MKKLILASLFAVSCSATAHIEGMTPNGSWEYQTKVNKMTDTSDYVAINISKDTFNDKFPRGVALLIRCSGGDTDAFLSVKDELQSDTPIVAMRFDGGHPVTQNWVKSDGSNTLFSPQPIDLIKELSRHKKAVFGFYPAGMTMQAVEFDLTGIQSVIKQVSDACHWQA